MNKVKAVICGEVITIKSRENEDYLARLARYVDQKLSNLIAKSTSAAIDERVRTILIALNISDDYFKSQSALENLQKKQKTYDLDVMQLHEEIENVTKERDDLLEEIEALKDVIAKLEEKIEAYELEEEEEQSSILSMPNVLRKNIAR